MQTVAYIMSRFPHLPETFILREILELEQQGRRVALYPLILQRQKVLHAEALAWVDRARPVPFLSTGTALANARGLWQQPAEVASVWRRVLWENRGSPNFLARAIVLLPKAVRMAGLMQREGVHHIHAHYATHPALVAWVVSRLTGITYSVTVHAHDLFVRKAMLATKLRDAAFVVAISDYNRQYIIEKVDPKLADKTHVIHCGIDPGVYAAAARVTGDDGGFEVVSVGSLQPYKGYPHLLKACALLRDRGVPLRCRIVGEGEDRPLLEGMIREFGLGQVVQLLGARTQDEVARLLPEAHVYVQPSVITPSGKMEGIPVALMEAMACRRPVVASSLSGIPELVRPGETGTLVPPADPDALAGALLDVRAHPDEAARQARAGRDLVARDFNLRKNVGRLASRFDSILQEGQS